MVKKQEQATTKQLTTQKIHTNKLHTKLVYSVEDRMHATMHHLQYSVKGALKVCEDFDMAKINQISLRKVV